MATQADKEVLGDDSVVVVQKYMTDIRRKDGHHVQGCVISSED